VRRRVKVAKRSGEWLIGPPRDFGLRILKARVGRAATATAQGSPPSRELAELDVNRTYFVDLARRLRPRDQRRLRVLDFGCGTGQTVRLLREAGFDCLGADVFYEGGDYRDPDLAAFLEQGTIRQISEAGELPFENDSFDLIISNMVLEHVGDLRQALAEMGRVLRPDGLMRHHFPSLEVLREGHIGLPIVHRLPRGRARSAYALTLRSLGLGYHKQGMSRREWTRTNLDWIDSYCNYRSRSQLLSEFRGRFDATNHELDYCRFRARSRPLIRRLLEIEVLGPLYERVFRRLAFMAVELRPRVSPPSGG
jgi:SAM-dependent methyltransferase